METAFSTPAEPLCFRESLKHSGPYFFPSVILASLTCMDMGDKSDFICNYSVVINCKTKVCMNKPKAGVRSPGFQSSSATTTG